MKMSLKIFILTLTDILQKSKIGPTIKVFFYQFQTFIFYSKPLSILLLNNRIIIEKFKYGKMYIFFFFFWFDNIDIGKAISLHINIIFAVIYMLSLFYFAFYDFDFFEFYLF